MKNCFANKNCGLFVCTLLLGGLLCGLVPKMAEAAVLRNNSTLNADSVVMWCESGDTLAKHVLAAKLPGGAAKNLTLPQGLCSVLEAKVGGMYYTYDFSIQFHAPQLEVELELFWAAQGGENFLNIIMNGESIFNESTEPQAAAFVPQRPAEAWEKGQSRSYQE